ncbi:MAG: ArnT family glycosyltransferase [Bacteroidales bacterium]
MLPGIKNKPTIFLSILLILLWTFNLLQAGFTELHYDEAYYWMFSKHLDWGYFDHPPMIALLINLGDYFPGELGVRFWVTALQPLYLFVFWLLIRRSNFNSRDALIYFLVALSVPLLEINGFIATPDAPLMFFTVMFLGAFKKYLESDSWLWSLLTGITMGLLAYSKYHGAIVVLSVIIANPAILKRGKTYFAAIVALVCLFPHFYWQYEHDFASFQYHLSDRSKSFKVKYIFEYLGNLFATFNPFLFPLLFAGTLKSRMKDPFERTVMVMSFCFLLFFGVSTFRGHVQPQWVLPATLGLLFSVVVFARQTAGRFKYVRIVSVVTVLLFIIARLNLVFGWINIPAMGFGYKNPMMQIYNEIGNKPLVLKSSYANAALYDFYTPGEANSQQEWSHRNSQYGFWNIDKGWYGEAVAVESDEGDHVIKLSNGKDFRYFINEHYIPTHKIEVDILKHTSLQLKENNQRIEMEITLHNPYSFPLHFSPESSGGLSLQCLVTQKKKLFYEKSLSARDFTVLAGQDKVITFDLDLNLAPGKYNIGFVVRDIRMSGWWANSKKTELEIISN